jgi:hypothetical protein
MFCKSQHLTEDNKHEAIHMYSVHQTQNVIFYLNLYSHAFCSVQIQGIYYDNPNIVYYSSKN